MKQRETTRATTTTATPTPVLAGCRLPAARCWLRPPGAAVPVLAVTGRWAAGRCAEQRGREGGEAARGRGARGGATREQASREPARRRGGRRRGAMLRLREEKPEEALQRCVCSA